MDTAIASARIEVPDRHSPDWDRAIGLMGLEAQIQLLPYALGFLGISLPFVLTVVGYAPNAGWFFASMALYALNLAIFYAILDWRKSNRPSLSNLRLHTAVHIAAGLLWSLALFQTAFYARSAGPLAEILLVLCTGAAVAVIFFSSPNLPNLLVVGPAAAAGPVLALRTNPETADTAVFAVLATALTLALSLILNRHLRSHFTLVLEREGLLVEREGALEETRRLAQSRSDILTTLSHDIRNGLSGVAHVLAGAVGAGSRGSPSREQLRAALSAARDLVEVLDATVDTEAAATDRLVVQREALDASQLVQDIVLLHRANANQAGLTLSFQVDPMLTGLAGAAVGDPARVRQILNNLVGNAVKYTTRGRIEVRLSPAASGVLRVEVVDTGPGLTPEELVQAFQPFQRIERTGGGVAGAGVGLTLARRLARLMGGDVDAESVPGVGSRFWLELPWDAAAVGATVDPAPTPLPQRLRILVVENDALQSAMLRNTLEQMGHKVLAVADARRGLDLLGMGPLDLLLVEADLPTLSGAEMIARVRSLTGPAAGLPIVAMSDGSADHVQAMLQAGSDSALRKPVTLTTLGRAIAEAIANRQKSRRPIAHPPLAGSDRAA
ncbi:MAG: response regulator [Caulobacterales bacterium]|nr:response regulator [Caulobacterales bacterium]